MRHSGVESCSSGVHVNAGHHTVLAPFCKAVVSVANIVQEVNNRNRHGNPGLEPLRSNSYRAHKTLALTPHAAAGTGISPSGRFLTSTA